ncbi:MAG: SGNH/GDSL hydrolase family protein [Actinomycetota bacterium]|nr:SGNH/GDSL hydrolase family protein [Actinomycetota bacterium]
MSVPIRWFARGAAYGGGGAGLLGAVGAGLLWSEAKLARHTVRPPETGAPLPAAEYGLPGAKPGPPLRVAVLGDSSAAGMGCAFPDETPGALLATSLAESGRLVELDVLAVVGSRSADLEPQVARALLNPPHVAVISIGANDVTHLVPSRQAVAELSSAVARLRTAGVGVVVGTCPDLSTVRPLAQPLRWLAGRRSKEMAAAQTVAVVAAGGVPVALAELLGPRFRAEPALFCSDRFHPSPAGYRLLADALLPAVAAAAGLDARLPGLDSSDAHTG